MGVDGEPIPSAAPPEPGKPPEIWKLYGPPVNEEFVAKLVKAAGNGKTEGGAIGKGSFLTEGGQQFEVKLQMGTDHEILGQTVQDSEGKAVFDKRQFLEAVLIISGSEPVDWDLKEIGARVKQVGFGYYGDQSGEETNTNEVGKEADQITITKFRSMGLDLKISKNPHYGGAILVDFVQYPGSDEKESQRYYDTSTSGAIELTDKFRGVAPIALQAVFLLAGEKIQEGEITTHYYKSYSDEVEQLEQLKKEYGSSAKATLLSTGEWVVEKPEAVKKESKSDTGREGLDSIFGQDVAVRKFRRITDAMKDPRYKELDAMPNLGVLLYGPPGTGKTSIGKAVAAELGANIFIMDSREVHTSYIGEAGKSITERLTSVLNYVNEQPGRKAVLLIDEIDSLAPKISSGTLEGSSLERAREQTTAFKNLLEQIVDNGNVLVIGTTNLREDVDPAVRNRLGEEIPMFPPDEKTAAQYTQSLVDTKVNRVPEESRPILEIQYDEVAQAFVKAGFVQRDIRKIVLETWSQAAHDHIRDGAEFRITTEGIQNMIRDWTRGAEMEESQKKGHLGFDLSGKPS